MRIEGETLHASDIVSDIVPEKVTNRSERLRTLAKGHASQAQEFERVGKSRRTVASGRKAFRENPCLPANSHFTRQTTVKHTFASVSNALFDGSPKREGGSPFHNLKSAKDFSGSTSVRIPETLARLVKQCQLRLHCRTASVSACFRCASTIPSRDRPN
jgi:hypothetical protein